MSDPSNFKFGGAEFGGADLDDHFVRTDLFTVGNLWSWGKGTSGQLGDNTSIGKSSPVQTISGGTNWKQVSGGGDYTAAIKTDGTLWLWGWGEYGQLGDNTVTNKSSPVQTISGGNNWKQVACGQRFTAAIKTDGTLWSWGPGTGGNLGNNSTLDRSSPVQTISGGNNWKQVACSNYYTAAIKTDGTLWLWGFGTSGQLGDNTVINRSSPVQTISGGTNWKQVSCGGSTGTNSTHTAAIKTDGSLWLWGNGSDGQLGDNTITNKSSPVQTISGGTNWKQVACGQNHTSAIKTDGSLWSWGKGTSGELGDNTEISKSSPVQTVSGGTNWKQVSCGHAYTAAIKTDGSLWSWGLGTSGQLGNNTVITRSSPVQTVSGGTNWKQVSCGNVHAAAIIQEEYTD